MLSRYREGLASTGELDPVLAADFDGLPERVCAHIDRAELTLALDEIWQRVRRLNRYVEERAPWTLAKDPERAGELDLVLRSLLEGLRSVTVLLWAFMPTSTERLLEALGAPERSITDAALGAGRIERVAEIAPLFPKDAQAAEA